MAIDPSIEVPERRLDLIANLKLLNTQLATGIDQYERIHNLTPSLEIIGLKEQIIRGLNKTVAYINVATTQLILLEKL